MSLKGILAIALNEGGHCRATLCHRQLIDTYEPQGYLCDRLERADKETRCRTKLSPRQN
ncbi:MAG TPA: hypothetical protein V6D09_17900 [Leptolyngbyaceae cyanobacterium]